jgi:hypothetical protein
MTTGILDSIAVLNLLLFFDNEFGILIEPRKPLVNNFHTTARLLVWSSLKRHPSAGKARNYCLFIVVQVCRLRLADSQF